ncbi:MAG TPA: aspartate/glutamate racemase family protein [Burkholderiaceae bacterium]|nr:aspartate/glutamate racemase family protein [Burkholderiaceae bacterium]
MKLLLINPNTSAHITARMVAAARDALGGAAEVTGATATFGPAVIGTRSEAAIAAHAALEIAAREAPGHDAVVLGVSLDCGLAALRELLDVPVAAMTESGLALAGMLGTRLGLLTLGARMLPLYRELVDAHGLSSRVVGWCALDQPAAFAPGDAPDPRVADAVADGVARLVAEDGVEAVLLSGAVLAGYAEALRDRVDVPLVDCAAAAALQAAAELSAGARPPRAGSLAPPRGRASSGLSDALAARLATPGPASTAAPASASASAPASDARPSGAAR